MLCQIALSFILSNKAYVLVLSMNKKNLFFWLLNQFRYFVEYITNVFLYFPNHMCVYCLCIQVYPKEHVAQCAKNGKIVRPNCSDKMVLVGSGKGTWERFGSHFLYFFTRVFLHHLEKYNLAKIVISAEKNNQLRSQDLNYFSYTN